MSGAGRADYICRGPWRLTPSAADAAALARPTGTSDRPRAENNFACGINVIGPVRISRENILLPFFGNM
jgi:hypothetical protein